MLVLVGCQTCGKQMKVYPSAITGGRGKNCSRECKARSRCNITHGRSRTRLHTIWLDMKARCREGSQGAAYYHDRGIRVCEEWSASFETFRDWAMANGYADDLEIDRKDNEKGYEPENCRWATRHQQMANQRKRANAQTSRFRGVSWCGNANKWRAQIQVNGKHRHIGLFASEEAAARAYDSEATRVFGVFASTNFKEGLPS